MKIKITMIIAMLATVANSQDFRESINRSLVADQRASRVGDLVTILIVEATTASNDARTSASRSSDISVGGNVYIPIPEQNIGTGNQFKGEGGTSSRGFIRAKMSARVDSVLSNGNLIIKGTKTSAINGEEQNILISGIVRPADIQADNSIYSYNIADASIVIEGSGLVSRSQGPGWITKLFHWLF